MRNVAIQNSSGLRRSCKEEFGGEGVSIGCTCRCVIIIMVW